MQDPVATVAFVYPPGPADESTPLADVPDFLRSALRAEAHLQAFHRPRPPGCRATPGIALRPARRDRHTVAPLHAHLYITDAANAISAALTAPAGIYNVVDDTDRVSHQRFTTAPDGSPARGR